MLTPIYLSDNLDLQDFKKRPKEKSLKGLATRLCEKLPKNIQEKTPDLKQIKLLSKIQTKFSDFLNESHLEKINKNIEKQYIFTKENKIHKNDRKSNNKDEDKNKKEITSYELKERPIKNEYPIIKNNYSKKNDFILKKTNNNITFKPIEEEKKDDNYNKSSIKVIAQLKQIDNFLDLQKKILPPSTQNHLITAQCDKKSTSFKENSESFEKPKQTKQDFTSKAIAIETNNPSIEINKNVNQENKEKIINNKNNSEKQVVNVNNKTIIDNKNIITMPYNIEINTFKNTNNSKLSYETNSVSLKQNLDMKYDKNLSFSKNLSKHLVDKVKELQTMMNQKNIKNGISEFRVNLQPHSLGPIDIKIEIKDQSVYAVFLTNHKEDLHTLYDMKNAIQTIFKENNLEAKDQNLNFFMNQQNHHPRKYNNYHQPSEVLNDKLPEWLWTYQPSVTA